MLTGNITQKFHIIADGVDKIIILREIQGREVFRCIFKPVNVHKQMIYTAVVLERVKIYSSDFCILMGPVVNIPIGQVIDDAPLSGRTLGYSIQNAEPVIYKICTPGNITGYHSGSSQEPS